MNLRRLIALAFLCGGVWQLGSGFYIPAKAWLAQHLIQHAWHSTQHAKQPSKPWMWADIAPVARLVVPGHDQDLIVLSGASGEALAFGPGHVTQSGAPGSDGHIVIGGHRDTHFRFLRHVQKGQAMQLQSPSGTIVTYEVESITIADTTKHSLMVSGDEAQLTLVTCYPFNGLSADKDLRYVVTARQTDRVSPPHS